MNSPAIEIQPNVETPIAALNSGITSNEAFFVRSHFSMPTLDVRTWRIEVAGDVKRHFTLDYEALQSMRQHSVAVTLECAGNGRTGFEKAVPGELRWGNGAVGTAVWTGIPLNEILGMTEIHGGANQVVVRGADAGPEPEGRAIIDYARSLPLDKALDEDTILALYMNGNPLPRHHGYPARLIVPGWYGMASVKWVKEIEVISGEPFRAFFNGKKYVYITDKEEVPVTDVRVKSLVTYPADGDMVEMRKPVAILGKAWSGDGLIERVEVCIEGRWIEAMLEQPMGRYAWTTWRAIWTPNEDTEFTISVRATDEKGNVQPNQPELNQYQYGYNALHRIRVRVR